MNKSTVVTNIPPFVTLFSRASFGTAGKDVGVRKVSYPVWTGRKSCGPRFRESLREGTDVSWMWLLLTHILDMHMHRTKTVRFMSTVSCARAV